MGLNKYIDLGKKRKQNKNTELLKQIEVLKARLEETKDDTIRRLEEEIEVLEDKIITLEDKDHGYAYPKDSYAFRNTDTINPDLYYRMTDPAPTPPVQERGVREFVIPQPITFTTGITDTTGLTAITTANIQAVPVELGYATNPWGGIITAGRGAAVITNNTGTANITGRDIGWVDAWAPPTPTRRGR